MCMVTQTNVKCVSHGTGDLWLLAITLQIYIYISQKIGREEEFRWLEDMNQVSQDMKHASRNLRISLMPIV